MFDPMLPKLAHFMEYLESEYARARGKTPHDEARRALLACSIEVLQLAEKITRKFKDKESIDSVLNKCIAGDKPLPWKELCELTESIGGIKGKFHGARLAEEKRKEREEKKRLRAEANAIAVAAATATAIQVAADAIAVIAVAKAKKATEVPPVAKPRKEKQKIPIPKVIKDEIWDYYIGNDVAQTLCPCCQKKPITMREFVAGHVLSEKNGGAITRENLVPICNNCNSSMGARHMIEFTQTHYRRQPVCPRNPVVCEEFVPEVVKPSAAKPTSNYVRYEHCRVPEVAKPSTIIPTSNYVRYEHCRAFSGGHMDSGKFPSEEEAIAHAKAKGYATILRKASSLAMYYFMDKPCKECKVATIKGEGGWDFVSWRLE